MKFTLINFINASQKQLLFWALYFSEEKSTQNGIFHPTLKLEAMPMSQDQGKQKFDL